MIPSREQGLSTNHWSINRVHRTLVDAGGNQWMNIACEDDTTRNGILQINFASKAEFIIDILSSLTSLHSFPKILVCKTPSHFPFELLHFFAHLIPFTDTL